MLIKQHAFYPGIAEQGLQKAKPDRVGAFDQDMHPNAPCLAGFACRSGMWRLWCGGLIKVRKSGFGAAANL
jgi:hypothetical protein